MAPDNLPNHRNSWQLGLGLVAILAIVLGFWQIRNSIRLPFIFPLSEDSSKVSYETDESDELLKTRDSDNDGLTDYEEKYFYRTSWYLPDTDSDGVDDKTETIGGTDPNCPADKTCGVVFETSEAAAGFVATTPPTAAAIRAYLKQNGVSDDLLAAYSDEQLLDLYREVSGGTSSLAPASNGAGSTPSPLTAEEKAALQQMSPADLRQFLIKSGADKATLDKIDDATLRAMVEEIIGE